MQYTKPTNAEAYPTWDDVVAISTENHAAMVAKGFWDKPMTFRGKMALVRGELSEAIEAYRKERRAPKSEYAAARRSKPWNVVESGDDTAKQTFVKYFEDVLKDTVEDELCDAFIRLSDLYGAVLTHETTPVSGHIWLTRSPHTPDDEDDRDFFMHTDEEYEATYRNFATNLLKEGSSVIDWIDYVSEGSYEAWRNDKFVDVETIVYTMSSVVLLCRLLHFDMMTHIAMKRAYNQTRPYLHGKIA